ncbi:hypothetical protein [Pseudidiomarina halophila]|uniref:hypothetical protein n=1 Tax=Pseudidiomarina halophila TaxID=1449799 RepID=UPI00361B84B5
MIRELEIVTDEVVVSDGQVFFSSDDGEGNVEIVRHVSRQMRDHAREVRELRRRVRDLELAKNTADGDTQAIEQELAAAQAELREREAAVAVARTELAEAREELQAKAAEHRAKRAERKASQLAKFEQTMASTLCDYGRTLSALPAQENVSFIVENGGDDESGEDKIFIFNKQQLDNCSSTSDLLAKATTYSF